MRNYTKYLFKSAVYLQHFSLGIDLKLAAEWHKVVSL
jgi:hypothetical protein